MSRGRFKKPDAKERYLALGAAQRGEPEDAMVEAQYALGGGVMFVTIEHAGDLMHRANDPNTWESAGYEYVFDKVRKLLRWLTQPYGFRREHEGNMRNNAAYHSKREGISEKDYFERVEKALARYAKAHAALKVENQAQRVMQRICVALGESRFEDATEGLEALRRELGTGAEWVAFAHEGAT